MKQLSRILLVLLGCAVWAPAQQFQWQQGVAEFCAGDSPTLLMGWGGKPPSIITHFDSPIMVRANHCWRWKSDEEPHRLLFLVERGSSPLFSLQLAAINASICGSLSGRLILSWDELQPLFWGIEGSVERPRGGWLGGEKKSRRQQLLLNLRYVYEKLSRSAGLNGGIDFSNDLRVVATEIEREGVELTPTPLIDWWKGGGFEQRLKCSDLTEPWNDAALLELQATKSASVLLQTTAVPSSIQWRWQNERSWKSWKGELNYSLELQRQEGKNELLAIFSNNSHQQTILRIPISWPPLPRLIDGVWGDSDENGLADRVRLRFSDVEPSELPASVSLHWPDGALWWSGKLEGGKELDRGVLEWELSLPEDGARSTGEVRAEVEWQSGKTKGRLKDEIGPLLLRAVAEPRGVLLTFSERPIGLQPGMLRFGAGRQAFADATLKGLSQTETLLKIDLKKLQRGMPVWLAVSPEEMVVDPYGNSAPLRPIAVELEGEIPLSSKTTAARLHLEPMVELQSTPAAETFGAVTHTIQPATSLAPHVSDDAVMDLQLLLPLTEEALRDRPTWSWTVRIFTAQGSEVASTSGSISCAVLSTGCAAAPREVVALSLPWNLRTNSGRLVSSGSYLVQWTLEGGGLSGELIGKVGVLRSDGSEHPIK